MEGIQYRIYSKSGLDCGVWFGETQAYALLAMHRDAGYGSDRVWLSDDGTDVEFGNDDDAMLCGKVDDWIILEEKEGR